MAFDLDTHRLLHWNFTHTPDSADQDFHYIDIAKMLSEVNRRTYRQGMSYDVANITFHDSDATETFIKVCTAPNTWVIQAAWNAAFSNWYMQQSDALESVNLEAGPWHDFKVLLNIDHKTDVDAAIFVDVENNTLSTTGSATTGPGEWVYSKLLIPNQPQDSGAPPDSADLGLLGPHVGSITSSNMTYVSATQVLENIVKLPQEDPEVPANLDYNVYSWINPQQSEPEVLQQVLSDLDDDNDLPPYSATIMPGAGTPGTGRPSEPWVVREACIPGGGSHMAAVGGFTAPCGLVCIETTQDTESDLIGVTLELVPGNYKGVSARPMRGGGF